MIYTTWHTWITSDVMFHSISQLGVLGQGIDILICDKTGAWDKKVEETLG